MFGKIFGGGRPHKKALIIGLDGVPYTLMKRFVDEDVMPTVLAAMGAAPGQSLDVRVV